MFISFKLVWLLFGFTLCSFFSQRRFHLHVLLSFIGAVPMHKCWRQHSCMSTSISIAIRT